MSELDLVFICDCTGSMGSYINAAKQNIETIITKIIQFEKSDVRFALIEYRDHPPEDRTFAFRLTNFTSSLNEMKRAVNQMEANGGGDTPESICCAFNCAVNLEWREDATKIIIWIADAPPHGFMKHGDGFPNGCPCHCDLIEEVRKCVNKDIVIYSVGTEPLQVAYLRTLMRAVSEIANGQYVALSTADLLSDLIINGCREEIQMKRIVNEVKRRLESTEGFDLLTEDERMDRINSEVTTLARDIQIDTVVIDSIFEEELAEIPDIFRTSQNLKELKRKMYNTPDINVRYKNLPNRNNDYPLFGMPHPPMMCCAPPPPPPGMPHPPMMCCSPPSPPPGMPSPMMCCAPSEPMMPSAFSPPMMCCSPPPLGSSSFMMRSPSPPRMLGMPMMCGAPPPPPAGMGGMPPMTQQVHSIAIPMTIAQQNRVTSRVSHFYNQRGSEPEDE